MDASELLQRYATGRRYFIGVNLVRADLRGAVLRGIVLKGADLTAAQLDGADLRGAELSNINLCGARMKCINLAGATLRWADLAGADLLRANLRGANLSHARLHHANATAATFHRADLSMADLRHADLRETDLTETKLTETELCKANLSRASLVGADCAGADFKDARFRDTDLAGLDMSAAKPGTVSYTFTVDRLEPAAARIASKNKALERRAAAPRDVAHPAQPIETREAVLRAMHWVTLWTFFSGIGGAVIGCAVGSRPEIEQELFYATAGFAAAALLGLAVGIASAMMIGERFGKRAARENRLSNGSFDRDG